MSRSDIPTLREAVPEKARASKLGDPVAISAADANLTAARINSAIDAALTASGARLRAEHAAALSARLDGAAS